MQQPRNERNKNELVLIKLTQNSIERLHFDFFLPIFSLSTVFEFHDTFLSVDGLRRYNRSTGACYVRNKCIKELKKLWKIELDELFGRSFRQMGVNRQKHTTTLQKP